MQFYSSFAQNNKSENKTGTLKEISLTRTLKDFIASAAVQYCVHNTRDSWCSGARLYGLTREYKMTSPNIYQA